MKSTASVIAQNKTPSRDLNKLPDEVKAIFDQGMTVDQFLAQTKGPIPEALLPYTTKSVAVIIEMESPSLIASMTSGNALAPMSSSVQKAYVNSLMQAQAPLVAQIKAHQGTILGQYTKAYNGVLALIPGTQLKALRSMAGVKAIHRAPKNTIELQNSVPLIRADQVWTASPTGYTGDGVTIAIIDTGIDYTHEAFGGTGGTQRMIRISLNRVRSQQPRSLADMTSPGPITMRITIEFPCRTLIYWMKSIMARMSHRRLRAWKLQMGQPCWLAVA